MRGPPITHERAMQLARSRAPKQLSMTQLDRLSGRIAWPVDLRSARFAADRKLLEAMFREAADRGDAVPYVEARQASDRMLNQLCDEIEELPTERYLAARRFLTSLAHAARTAGTEAQLAQNP